MNNFLTRLLAVSELISKVLVWTGGALILGSAFLVSAEVILRQVFNYSLAGADELSGYAFAIATSLGFSYVLFQRAHIRVDVIYVFLPARLIILLHFVGLLALGGFAFVVTAMVWQLVMDTIANGSRSITPLRTPLTLVQLPWLIGWMFFLWCAMLLFVVSLRDALNRDKNALQRKIGIKTTDELIVDNEKLQ